MSEYEYACKVKGVIHGVVKANSESEAVIKAELDIMQKGYEQDGDVDVYKVWDEWEMDSEY